MNDSETMLSLVPTELIEKIIDEVVHFEDDSAETLKVLSQTCKVFLGPAQRRLFHSVKVQVAGRSAQLSALYGIITSSPRILSYVQHLQAYYDYKNTDSPEAVSLDPLLSHFLSELPNITGFHLNFHYRLSHRLINQPCDWDKLPLSLQDALVKVISKPTLVFLKIQGVKNIPKVVAEFLVFIPTVTLETTSFQFSSSSGITSSYSRGITDVPERRLRNLTVFSGTNSDSAGILVDTLRSHNINLEKIHFGSPHDAPMVFDILRQHGRLLNGLTYDGTTPWISKDQSFNLEINDLPHLTMVKFTAWFGEKSGVLDHIVRFLATASASSKVEEIDVDLIYISVPERLTEDWIALDALLSGEKYSHLRRLNIYPCKYWGEVHNTSKHEKQDLSTKMHEGLPNLQQNGLVQIFPIKNKLLDLIDLFDS